MAQLKLPKYYRQRFLLILLKQAGGKLSKVDFQKLIFLSQRKENLAFYDFVPYHYGCYSFQAQSDIELMGKVGWFNIGENGVELCEDPYGQLQGNGSVAVARFSKKYKEFRGRKLVAYVYEHYPYYATRSKIAEDVLTSRSFEKVRQVEESYQKKESRLFTIGYEGISFENYVNKLIKNDVHILCDVRKNPLSRKFGFSKGTLNRLLPKLGIKYVHIPDLGIISEDRSKLNSEEDYIRLFDAYRKTLEDKRNSLERLEALLKSHKRIALTCFEKEHSFCHRHCISDYLEIDGIAGVTHL